MEAYTEKQIIEAAFKYYRKTGFPYEQFAPHQIMQVFNNLKQSKNKLIKQKNSLLKNRSKIIGMGVGKEQQIVNYFHPHIWDSYAVGMRAPTYSFTLDKSLKATIKLSIKFDKIINDHSVRNYLRKVHGTQMCSNFRPSIAKTIYDYFKVNNALDMSTGYGGRLLGFLASNAKGKYYGYDPNTETCKCNIKMSKFFNASKKVTIINKPFEDARLSKGFDIAFTSPPYFAKEIYTDEETQSCIRYKDYNDWLENFLKIMLKKADNSIKETGIIALNVSDVKIKGKNYPLINDTIKTAESIGLKYAEYIGIKFPGFGKGLAKWKIEPILIFKKEKQK